MQGTAINVQEEFGVDETIPIGKCAKHLGVSKDTIYRLVESGQLRKGSIKIKGRRRGITVIDRRSLSDMLVASEQ